MTLAVPLFLRCFVPKIFRLPYDMAQYMMEFLDQEAKTACNRVLTLRWRARRLRWD